ncbi:alpha/beta hydrolase [Thermoflavimicrobium daqui]|jgi:phospholipase/carboxylesterase|uniref:Carboxylesterase n=1 Tax=Thermoflavimicrobium daqui TaxID=2137476 RepID=A0A364K1K0_9BACL|nr:alpha/beta hydrolase [Thermoflavimicrobium daqui]RAL21910.1 carboxylesterase [Thermoflavimicrobium daqui]
MKHFFHKGNDLSKPTLLLLHGTGGTETDLLPVAGMIDDTASVLGVRGNVIENGMPRFFRRLAEGVFDEQDLVFRTKELYELIDTAAKDYGFNRNNVIAVGYSNGANIAGSLLFHYEDALKGAILFHPMVPRRGIELPKLSGTPVFIGAGSNDPICKPEETKELAEVLERAGATVQIHWESFGHQLTQSEVQKAAAWYSQLM